MELKIEIRLIGSEETEHLNNALNLVNSFAEKGFMLSQSYEALQNLATLQRLVVALLDDRIVGVAGITFDYGDGLLEFGSWAVENEYQREGVGKMVLDFFLRQYDTAKLIALGNSNSAPIFRYLGARELCESDVPSIVFGPCETCNCNGKKDLSPGRRCVDSIFDLTVLRPIS